MIKQTTRRINFVIPKLFLPSSPMNSSTWILFKYVEPHHRHHLLRLLSAKCLAWHWDKFERNRHFNGEANCDFLQKRMSGRRHPLLLRLKNIITYLSGGRGWCTASSIDRNCITHGTKEWHVLHYIKLQALGINNNNYNGRCSLNSFVSEIKAHCDVRFQSVFDLQWLPWSSVNSYRSWL